MRCAAGSLPAAASPDFAQGAHPWFCPHVHYVSNITRHCARLVSFPLPCDAPPDKASAFGSRHLSSPTDRPPACPQEELADRIQRVELDTATMSTALLRQMHELHYSALALVHAPPSACCASRHRARPRSAAPAAAVAAEGRERAAHDVYGWGTPVEGNSFNSSAAHGMSTLSFSGPAPPPTSKRVRSSPPPASQAEERRHQDKIINAEVAALRDAAEDKPQRRGSVKRLIKMIL